jgi:hypothetical protein
MRCSIAARRRREIAGYGERDPFHDKGASYHARATCDSEIVTRIAAKLSIGASEFAFARGLGQPVIDVTREVICELASGSLVKVDRGRTLLYSIDHYRPLWCRIFFALGCGALCARSGRTEVVSGGASVASDLPAPVSPADPRQIRFLQEGTRTCRTGDIFSKPAFPWQRALPDRQAAAPHRRAPRRSGVNGMARARPQRGSLATAAGADEEQARPRNPPCAHRAASRR